MSDLLPRLGTTCVVLPVDVAAVATQLVAFAAPSGSPLCAHRSAPRYPRLPADTEGSQVFRNGAKRPCCDGEPHAEPRPSVDEASPRTADAGISPLQCFPTSPSAAHDCDGEQPHWVEPPGPRTPSIEGRSGYGCHNKDGRDLRVEGALCRRELHDRSVGPRGGERR